MKAPKDCLTVKQVMKKLESMPQNKKIIVFADYKVFSIADILYEPDDDFDFVQIATGLKEMKEEEK